VVHRTTTTDKVSFKATFSADVQHQADLLMGDIVLKHGVPTAVALARMILAKYESAE